MKKIWNQDETVKYDPKRIANWLITEPGEEVLVKGQRILLEEYKVNAIDEDGLFVIIGYYETKQEAVDEVNRLDALSKVAE